MSVGVVVGIVALHWPWSDDDVGFGWPSATLTQTPLDLPTKTVTVRFDVPRGGYWRATINEESPRLGCRSLVFPYDVEGDLGIFVERLGPPEQRVSAAIEVDGEVIQTVGPTTVEYPSFTIFYRVPENAP